jgi:hypothetical protein
MVSMPRPAIEVLAPKHPDALALLTILSARNGRDSTFWVANGMAGKHVGLTLPRFVRARKRLLELKMLRQVSPPRPRSPARYKWGEGFGCVILADKPGG